MINDVLGSLSTSAAAGDVGHSWLGGRGTPIGRGYGKGEVEGSTGGGKRPLCPLLFFTAAMARIVFQGARQPQNNGRIGGIKQSQ